MVKVFLFFLIIVLISFTASAGIGSFGATVNLSSINLTAGSGLTIISNIISATATNGTDKYMNISGGTFTGDVYLGNNDIWDVGQINATTLQINGIITSQGTDATENTITIRKPTIDTNNIAYYLSHRPDDKSLWIYGFNGSTYKNFIKTDWDNSYVIFEAGNVGIGTTSPQTPLEVIGTIRNTGQLQMANNQGIYMANTAGTYGMVLTSGGDTNLYIGDIENKFGSVKINAAGTTAIQILNTGNIGLGTTTPQAKLDIRGTAFLPTNYQLKFGNGNNNGNVSISNYGYNAAGLNFVGVDPQYQFDATSNNRRIAFSPSLFSFDAGTTAGVWNGVFEFNRQSPGNVRFGGGGGAGIFGNHSSVNVNPYNTKVNVGGAVNIGINYENISAPVDGLIVLGNTGIGTSSPRVKLDVVGDGNFSGNITAVVYHGNINWINFPVSVTLTGTAYCDYHDNIIAGYTYTCQNCINSATGATIACSTIVSVMEDCACKVD